MKERRGNILKAIKILLICWLAWSCIFLLSGIGNILRFALRETPGLFERDFYTIWIIIICLIILPLGGLEFSILTLKQSKIENFQETIPHDDSLWERYKAKVNQPTFFLLFSIIMYGAIFAIGILEVCVRSDDMERIAWGISMLDSFGAISFAGIPFILIKKEATEEQRKEARQRREKENRQAICEELLSVAGMRFFIKYFNYLQGWNKSDILDIIEEDYQEQDKHERIEASKKIFQKNLNQVALEIISESIKVDEETKSQAKKMMKTDKE